ncbi:MAG: ABC transporter permease [Candidatus Omnitrophota bacterium]|nr:ABC transporter permease [Candidatus Omnitrophota bacterium]
MSNPKSKYKIIFKEIKAYLLSVITEVGSAVFFLYEVMERIFTGRVRFKELITQIYEQGSQSVGIIILISLSTGMVLALQGYVILNRFGAKEYVAQLVALSLIRELSPILSSIVFSGKAGARISAELGTMSVNDQILATRTLGVDPIEFLAVSRILACIIVLPLLIVISELVGVLGGFIMGVFSAKITASYYLRRSIEAIAFVDFFSGLIKTVCFSVIIGWVCCYQGFATKGGSLGVGRYTTKAVAYCYIFIILSNFVLTKIILSIWG